MGTTPQTGTTDPSVLASSTEEKTVYDFTGVPIAVGDRIFKTAIAHGAPQWANRGTVVGIARVRVQVQWDQYLYDIKQPYHAVSPSVLRVIPSKRAESILAAIANRKA